MYWNLILLAVAETGQLSNRVFVESTTIALSLHADDDERHENHHEEQNVNAHDGDAVLLRLLGLYQLFSSLLDGRRHLLTVIVDAV
jgi:hypothetical protein